MPEPVFLNERDAVERSVGIGAIDVLKESGVLRTLLGSCIGLVLHDTRRRVGGMAHIVLPRSGGQSNLPGRYADTAVPELLRLIAAAGGEVRSLTAKIAGGATMFGPDRTNAIGEQNLAEVEKFLDAARIPVVTRHCGGRQGRRLAYDVRTGLVQLEMVGSHPVVL